MSALANMLLLFPCYSSYTAWLQSTLLPFPHLVYCHNVTHNLGISYVLSLLGLVTAE